MEDDSSSSSSSSSPESSEPFLQSTDADSISNPRRLNHRADGTTIKKKAATTKKMAPNENSAAATSSSPPPPPWSSKGVRVASKRRSTRFAFGSARRSAVADAISSRLGMSIAAFVSEILERKAAPSEMVFDDHLALVCASAVRESLANDFGDAFDSFVSNFEKSFRSTFRTLKLIKESSRSKENSHISRLRVEDCTSGRACVFGDCTSRRGDLGRSSVEVSHPEELFHTVASGEKMDENELSNSIGLALALRGQTDALTCVSRSPFEPITNRSVLSTIEKSVVEQARSNDLKTLELGLTMKKMKMKETELSLNFDSNNLERSKLAMGISKASFKAEKFKTQLEDVRHAELIRKCIDCLVAGLLLMAGSLGYGAYIYSYQKITEATASCTPSTKDSKSWWFPNPMASLNSGIQILSCQFQVVTRMLFGLFMIVSVAYLLVQRSKQAMPVTFIVLLLAMLCGAAGKFCVDTLGGSGFRWLLFWEAICLMHFLCNVFTSTVFFVLYGPLVTSPARKGQNRRIVAYWARRWVFYGVMLVVLPLLCGLLPFASLRDWKDHFVLMIEDSLSATQD